MYDTYWPINPFSEERSRVPILREVFPDWKLDKGIFDRLKILYEVPWADDAESSTLNYEYFGNHSGGKLVSPVILNILGENEFLDDVDRDVLANIIWTKFREPWSHLWLTNKISYNPIHNYDMSDTRTLVRGDSESRVSAVESDQSTEHGMTNETRSFLNGFNSTSDDGEPSDRTVSEDGGTTDVGYEDSRTSDAVAAREETETTQRSGNIGVTTTQQMITADRSVWLWSFFDQVYKDIDTVLSLPIYDICRV